MQAILITIYYGNMKGEWIMKKCLREFDEQAFINGIKQKEVKDIIDGLSVDELRQIKDDLKPS